MKKNVIVNRRNGNAVSVNMHYADTWLKRLVGLLSRSGLATGEGLLIKPCGSIHTIGMRFSIDVVFLDDDLRVNKLTRSLKPFRFCWSVKRTRSVLELPAGAIEASGLQCGDKLAIEP